MWRKTCYPDQEPAASTTLISALLNANFSETTPLHNRSKFRFSKNLISIYVNILLHITENKKSLSRKICWLNSCSLLPISWIESQLKLKIPVQQPIFLSNSMHLGENLSFKLLLITLITEEILWQSLGFWFTLFFSQLPSIHRIPRRCFLLGPYNASIRQEATNMFKQWSRYWLLKNIFLIGCLPVTAHQQLINCIFIQAIRANEYFKNKSEWGK